MEVTEHKSDYHVQGMVHLLIDGHFESHDLLYQTVLNVYQNFTSLWKALLALFEDANSKSAEGDIFSAVPIRGLITVCRCSLKRIIEEDGISIHEIHASVVADIELYLLDMVKCVTDVLSSSECSDVELPALGENDDTMEKFVKAYLEFEKPYLEKAYREASPIYCYQLITNSELMMEFLDHCIEDLKFSNIGEDEQSFLKEKFIFLRDYFKLLIKGRIYDDDLNKLLIAVENVAYVMAYSFSSEEINENIFWETNIRSVILLGVLKVLILQSDGSSSAPILSGELVIGLLKCVHDNLLELLNNDAIDLTGTLNGQLKILDNGLSFLMHLLTAYLPMHNSEQVKSSNIMLDFQALLRNVGCFIISLFDNPEIEDMSLGLIDLTEKADVIKGEIIKAVCCMVIRETERESPKKDQLGYLILFLLNLKEVMDHKPGLVVAWKDHMNLVLFTFYLIQNNIRGSDTIGEDEFSQKALHLDIGLTDHEELRGVLVSAQVVAFNLACHSLFRGCGRIRLEKLYLWTKGHVDMHIHIGILEAIVLSSTTPLTDKFMIAYGECVQESMILLLSHLNFDPVKDQFNVLCEGFSFLLRFLINYKDEQEKLSHFKVGFQDLMRRIGSEVCSYFSYWLSVDITKQSAIELSQMVEKMNLIIVETGELLYLVHIKKLGCESPKNNQLGSLDLLLQNWTGLMESESDLIITRKDQFQMIYENLVLFKSFLTSSTGDEESQNLCSSILGTAHVAEYLLTTYSAGVCPARCRDLWILEFMKHVGLIKETGLKFKEKKSGNVQETSTVVKDRRQLSAKASLVPTATDLVVGFELEMELIRERLADHLKQLNVISIVGMPGLGKSTLARKVYEEPFTKKHFDLCAWCCVSQEYNKKELLLAILDSMNKLTDEIRGKSETDLSVMVHKQLTGRRYFIVLDDIWDIDAFTYLTRFFPDDNKGSRIMLTSRSKVIGSQAQCNDDLIEPCILTDEQSWDLLKQKVYDKEKCPPELNQIGVEIAKQCRGLPLAVVVVGGVLATDTHGLEFWERVSRSLSSYLTRDSQSHFTAALELSYEFLPDYLKPMFLYIGAFPEDKEIPANMLMRLWIAEGFVQNKPSTSLEIQAALNLMDLIDRSLVMVARRRWDGRVKMCHVHDLLRDMCLAKAGKEKFMQQVHVNSRLPDHLMYQRRLSIYIEGNNETMSRHFVAYKDLPKFSITPPIYSVLLFCGGSNNVYVEPENINLEIIICNLKLLKVLDSNIFRIPQDILNKDLIMLVHLRYLSIKGNFSSIPSAISCLRSLETFIIESTIRCIDVPETIWEMAKLRYLHIGTYARFSASPENFSILENLETIFRPIINVGEEEDIFRKVPGLKKLNCYFDCHGRIPSFESLGKLESLTVVLYGKNLIGQLKLPLTLKKLDLMGGMWTQISISKTLLPKLEVLKLSGNCFVDKFWEMGEDDVFTNLKFLKLEYQQFERWSASSVNFPSLEKFVVKRCECDEIPFDLGEIVTLREIDVIECSSSLVKQVKEIQKEQEDFGNGIKFYFEGNDDEDEDEDDED